MEENMEVIDANVEPATDKEQTPQAKEITKEAIVEAINRLGSEVTLLKQLWGYKADVPLEEQIKPTAEELQKLHEKMYPTLSDAEFANRMKAMGKLIVG